MAVSEERREQCRRASLSRSPEQRKADAKKAAAASVKSRFGEARDLKQLEKLEKSSNSLTGVKHDAGGPDPAKVCRAIGLGEVAVLKGVKRLAEKSRSDTVRIRAYELLAKILRMIREDSQQNEGVTVVIQALEGSPQQVNIATPAQPALPDPGGYRHPGRGGPPITITK
jgi:hypothetical protein